MNTDGDAFHCQVPFPETIEIMIFARRNVSVTFLRRSAVIALSCAMFLSGAALYGAGAVTVSDAAESYPLGLHLDYLEDRAGNLTVDDVAGGNFDKMFVPSREAIPNFAFTDSVYWVRFTVTTGGLNQPNWILEFSYPLMDRIGLYEVKKGSRPVLLKETGFALPFSTREIAQRFFLFTIRLGPGETKTYYLRLVNQDRMEIPLKLWSAGAYFARDRKSVV